METSQTHTFLTIKQYLLIIHYILSPGASGMFGINLKQHHLSVLDSIVVSIPACHAGDRGSIPRLGGSFHKY